MPQETTHVALSMWCYMHPADAAQEIASLRQEVERLRGLLQDCVEHMEWSTPPGKAAFDAALAALAKTT